MVSHPLTHSCMTTLFAYSVDGVWPSDTTTVWPRSLHALLMVSDPLTQQLYDHALCMLCWWCLTLWHNNCMTTLFACSVDGVWPSDTTTVWPRSLHALLMVSDPLTQQLYDHALCMLCWWCLTLWHTAVWPRSLFALLMVPHPLTQQLYDHALCLLCWWCLTLWHNNCMTTLFAYSVDGVSPSDTQLYDHALCLLCWWCLTLWHTAIWPRSLFALLMVPLPLWLARQSSHPNQEPLHTVRTAPRSSRTPFWKEDCEINVQNGFPPTVQNLIGGKRWGRQKDRLYKSRTLSDDSLHVNYSHETVTSSMNPAGPVITDHHLKSTKFFFSPFRFLAHKRNHHISKLTNTRTETFSGFVTNTPQHISANNVLRHYSPNKIETLIGHGHADINNYISERSKLDQVVMQWRLHLKALKAVFFRSYLWSSPKYIQWNLLDLKVVIFRFWKSVRNLPK